MPDTSQNIGVIASALSDDARDAARLSRAIGFDGLLFDAFGPSLSIPSLSATGRREFRHVLTSQAQALVGLRADLGPRGLGPGADIDRLLSRFDDVLRAAADLSAEVVCVDLGPLPEPAANAPMPKPTVSPEQAGLIILPTPATAPAPATASPAPDPALVSQVDTAMAALGAVADRYRATVAFSSALASFAALERALAAVRCPWFGVELDPVAILRDRWTSDEIFSRLGPLLRHVRARDAVVGSDRRTRPAEIGRGSVTWNELIVSLDDAGYRGWLTVDPIELPDRRAAAEAGLAALRAASRR